MFLGPLLGLVITLAFVSTVTCSSTPQTAFDYVIVGAGPAGLVLANRLSSDPNVQVAVIEAGDSAYNNPLVQRVDTFGLGLNTSVDWSYASAPQKYSLNRTFPYYAGKGLGGTTLINGMTYLRAEKAQIDQWEEFGNPGWNWDSLFEYYKEEEHFQPPEEWKVERGAVYEADVHGFKGEVAVGWSKYLMGMNMSTILNETSRVLGYPIREDPNGGSMSGFSIWPFTLNATDNVREDAARAYYYPIAEERKNLHVYLNTTASRIIWDDASSENESGMVARGVEIIAADNVTSVLSASQEVIVSAGSIRSPALLEHSGVGNPGILESLGIRPVINLPAVGSTLQDQPQSFLSYLSPTNWTDYPSWVAYLTASDLFGSDLPSISQEVHANISTYAATIVADSAPGSTTQEIEEHILKMQADLIFSEGSTVPLAELLWFPGPASISMSLWNLLPFSRGAIHITTSNLTHQPSINPNFFQLPIDLYVQAAAVIKARELFATPPLSNHVTAEIMPNFTNVPEEAGIRDERWEEWIKPTYGSNYHPLATCAMRSRELGGVVDPAGKLYGSKNVRVVDASIMPMQISGHLSASVYAIALKIADGMVKERTGVV